MNKGYCTKCRGTGVVRLWFCDVPPVYTPLAETIDRCPAGCPAGVYQGTWR